MTLYNLRTDGDNYRITKFTNDLDVESSYLTSHNECACPAGHRPTCRHRQMLPTMLAANLCDSGGFYDFEAQQVLLPVSDEPVEIESMVTLPDDADVAEEFSKLLHPRPTFTESTVGITPEELAAELPTYEEAVAESIKPTEDKPHPHLPKVDRRV